MLIDQHFQILKPILQYEGMAAVHADHVSLEFG